MTSDIDVQFEGVTKLFGKLAALDDLTFNVRKGEFYCLIGPSGCGKTTALRSIAGLIMPDAGKILIKGQDMSGVPTHKRPISMVFQTWALFPHMTVLQNVAFGLRMRGLPEPEMKQRVKEALDLVRLTGLEGRHPRELSGGQQQRVGLARAIVLRPEVVLLDEPLGNLDAKLQAQMQIELKLLHKQLGICFIYVTHDQAQAMTLGDRIMVMNMGKIEQEGSPSEIYNSPESIFVGRFVGESNLIKAKVTSAKGNLVSLESEYGRFDGPYRGDANKLVGKSVTFIVRPERVKIGKAAQIMQYQLDAVMKSTVYKGSEVSYIIDVRGVEFRSKQQLGAAEYQEIPDGKPVKIGWNVEDITVLDKVSVVKGYDVERAILGA
jgi:ABC-type Fe3+/spermidine/putrescine transport system ATPase subunit